MALQKKVVDEVFGWLRIYEDGSVDRTWTGPPEAKFLVDPVPPHEDFVEGVSTRDVVIDEKSGQRVRIYLPEIAKDGEAAAETKLPILLHFHGGGFCITQADCYMYYHAYAKLAGSARAICVSPYLRRAPEHRLPAAIEDGYSALEWLGAVARGEAREPWLESHADFSRVFLIGDSTGGNIVHEVAKRALGREGGELSPARVAGAIPIHPGFVRAERSRSELEHPQSPFFSLEMVDKLLSFALPPGSTKDHPFTCPMGRDASSRLAELSLPPMLLCVAEKDLIVDTEMEFYRAMKEANKDVELLISHGMTHCFYMDKIAADMDPNAAAEIKRLFAAITEFISKH